MLRGVTGHCFINSRKHTFKGAKLADHHGPVRQTRSGIPGKEVAEQRVEGSEP
jgi:hypothetical protein